MRITDIIKATTFTATTIGALCFTSIAAHAYEVSPMQHRLSLTGKSAISFITIRNTHDYPLTVELNAERREMESGIVKDDVEASDDFIIFPPQAIIQPGKSQRVQIRYVGEPIATSNFYRLVVSQVPVNLSDGDTTSLNVAYNFISAVYVAPEDAEADVVVESISPSAKGGFDVSMSNEGNYHALLSSFVWTASDGAEDKVLDASRVPLGNAPFIEPGGTRTIHIPRDALGDMSNLASLKILKS